MQRKTGEAPIGGAIGDKGGRPLRRSNRGGGRCTASRWRVGVTNGPNLMPERHRSAERSATKVVDRSVGRTGVAEDARPHAGASALQTDRACCRRGTDRRSDRRRRWSTAPSVEPGWRKMHDRTLARRRDKRTDLLAGETPIDGAIGDKGGRPLRRSNRGGGRCKASRWRVGVTNGPSLLPEKHRSTERSATKVVDRSAGRTGVAEDARPHAGASALQTGRTCCRGSTDRRSDRRRRWSTAPPVEPGWRKMHGRTLVRRRYKRADLARRQDSDRRSDRPPRAIGDQGGRPLRRSNRGGGRCKAARWRVGVTNGPT